MTKIVYIMRGIPGTGKSTLAKRICDNAGVICSADHFFEHDGVYNFDIKLISKAHQYCKDKFMKAIKEGVETIVIDNTNTTKKEYRYYIDIAKQHGYKVAIKYPESHLGVMVEDYVNDRKGIDAVDPSFKSDLLDELEAVTHRCGDFHRVMPRQVLENMLNRFEWE